MKPCRTHAIHHAYPDPEYGVVPCCGIHWEVLTGADEVVTTDAGRVNCAGGGR